MRRSPLIGLSLLLWSGLTGAEPPERGAGNLLQNHPSPYLAMHAADPVHWRLWNSDAFARAANEGKLLYVSSGYFSCHWCHVMQQESYRDPRIAALINRHFVAVKIDRELLPAVDAGLIDFTKRTRGQAGWPLNVFLTPQGYPLLGVLYLAPPEFERLLNNLEQRWRVDAAALTSMARAAAEAIPPPPVADSAAPHTGDLWRALRDQALAHADELQGGFGAQAKFPMAPQLLALLHIFEREPHAALGEFLRLTLEHMADQGLHDHLGGGFFRYTTDPDWQTPHFEKMLYDNALLVRVYLEAAKVLDAPEFLAVARRTLDFVLDQLRAPEGGYYAGLSAVDAAGVEGGFYLWHRAEIEDLAGEYWALARRYWGLDGAAPFEAGYLPVPQSTPAQMASEFNIPIAEVESAIEAVRARLLQRRAQRTLPVDDQALAGWNGLLLWALADAVAVFEPGSTDGRYGRAAQALQRVLKDFIVEGRLVRARHGAQVASPATLEDYAYVVAGLQRWGSVSGASADQRDRLGQLIEQAWSRFYAAGRWRLGEDALLRWGSGATALEDGPMPAPSAVLMAISREVRSQTERTDEALRDALPWVQSDPFGYASHLILYP